MCNRVIFFKQKTAYEMRISDGSSDVCSSDLGGPSRQRAWGAQLWLKKPPSAMRCLSSAATVTLGGESRNTLLVTRSIVPRVANTRPAAKSKIGRATCRDRVCQYV